jgi:hypothetical protein
LTEYSRLLALTVLLMHVTAVVGVCIVKAGCGLALPLLGRKAFGCFVVLCGPTNYQAGPPTAIAQLVLGIRSHKGGRWFNAIEMLSILGLLRMS